MDIKIVVIDSAPTTLKGALRALEDSYTIHYFSTIEEFFERIESPLVSDEPEDIDQMRDYEASQGLTPVDILIVEIDLFQEEPVKWVINTQEKLKKLNATPMGGITKFILTSFERENFKITSLHHHFIYDFLFKPLDQPLWLQKIEMIAQLPKISSPGHLFSHKSVSTIEMSKECQLTHITEFGITILNPSPVKPGAFANFRIPFPDQKRVVKFIGRSYKCEASELPNYYNCSFTYFGIDSSDMRHQRVLFQKLEQKKDTYNFEDRDEQELSKEARSLQIRQKMLARSKGGPAGRGTQKTDSAKSNLTLNSNESPKDVVIIDMDRLNIDAVQHSFQQNFPNAHLHCFPTMAFFLKKLKERRKAQDSEASQWTTPGFSFGRLFSIEIDLLNDEICKFNPTPKDNDDICGYTGKEFVSDKRLWKKLIDENDLDELNEFFRYASSGEKSELDFQLKNSQGEKRWFLLSASSPGEDRVLLKISDESTKNKKPGIIQEDPDDEEKPLEKIDLIVLSTSFVTGPYLEWREQFMQRLREAGLSVHKNMFFIFLKPEDSKANIRNFCRPEVVAFFNKPMDRRLFIECVAITLNLITEEFKKTFLKSESYERAIEIGRPVNIEKISEFGVVASNKSALQPGSLFNLHSTILTSDDGRGTLARCLGFEVDPDDEEKYLIHFLFYGVRDQSLKRIRKMIREEYVQKKEKGNN